MEKNKRRWRCVIAFPRLWSAIAVSRVLRSFSLGSKPETADSFGTKYKKIAKKAAEGEQRRVKRTRNHLNQICIRIFVCCQEPIKK